MQKSNTVKAGERTQHTPGPWTVAEYGIAEARAKYLCLKKGGRTICRIDAQGNSLSTNDEDEANSHLIAAAPELLAAALGAVAALSQTKTFPADIEAAKSFLNAAIGKAEGKI